ncbi:MAG: extracellular solute-binding protein, partial [Candidatus Falkowbacteria bacterium]|nr:extracellular solute-binding protein [Candidatus Falkowbacteria bacterium]
MPKKILILFLLGIFILGSGFGCKTTDPQTQAAMTPITLNYWRVFDGPDDFQDIIKEYQKLHPFITINYRKLRYDEFETELINALAEDRGPDIFSIQNTWVKKYQNKIAPLPAETTMAYPVVSGSIKKEIINQLQTTKSLSPKDVKDKFVDVVGSDVILEDGKIYGLPLSVDTLAMYYNRDLFNGAGIVEVPTYWNKDFQQDVKKLTKQDAKKQIIQSGIALGGSTNINRASDILSVLMMQNGAIMLGSKSVQFNTVPNKPGFKENNYNPGLEALRFYSDFSNPAKEVYAWNDTLPNSLEMFTSGNLAI